MTSKYKTNPQVTTKTTNAKSLGILVGYVVFKKTAPWMLNALPIISSVYIHIRTLRKKIEKNDNSLQACKWI